MALQSSGDPITPGVFKRANVMEEQTKVKADLRDANLVWSNDYSWSVAAQQVVEEMALEALPPGGVLVLYRPPHFASRWKDGGRIRVATSWNPRNEMYILAKPVL